eukprot:389112-Prorocentrum_minimum.AAC.1
METLRDRSGSHREASAVPESDYGGTTSKVGRDGYEHWWLPPSAILKVSVLSFITVAMLSSMFLHLPLVPVFTGAPIEEILKHYPDPEMPATELHDFGHSTQFESALQTNHAFETQPVAKSDAHTVGPIHFEDSVHSNSVSSPNFAEEEVKKREDDMPSQTAHNFPHDTEGGEDEGDGTEAQQEEPREASHEEEPPKNGGLFNFFSRFSNKQSHNDESPPEESLPVGVVWKVPEEPLPEDSHEEDSHEENSPKEDSFSGEFPVDSHEEGSHEDDSHEPEAEEAPPEVPSHEVETEEAPHAAASSLSAGEEPSASEEETEEEAVAAAAAAAAARAKALRKAADVVAAREQRQERQRER